VDVVTVGETLAVVVADAPGPLRHARSLHLSVAGAESNAAIGLARLGHRVSWVGRVGDDELGRLVLDRLRAEQVDVRRVRVDPDAPTALMVKERRLPGVGGVTYYRAGSAGSRLDPSDVAGVVAGARVLHLSGITPALGRSAAEAVREVLAAARSAGALVSFDVNHRAALWPASAAGPVLSELATASDVVLAGEDELPLVAPAAVGGPGTDGTRARAEALLEAGVGQVVVTRGGSGAVAYTAQEVLAVPAVPVPTRDAVGAGDAFAAGYLSALLDGLPLAARLARGCVTGAFAVASEGDWEGAPRRAELGLLEHPEGTVLR